MYEDTIDQKPANATKISDSLQSIVFNSIRNVVSDELVEQTCREVDYAFRKRKITPVVTVLHMVNPGTVGLRPVAEHRTPPLVGLSPFAGLSKPLGS